MTRIFLFVGIRPGKIHTTPNPSRAPGARFPYEVPYTIVNCTLLSMTPAAIA